MISDINGETYHAVPNVNQAGNAKHSFPSSRSRLILRHHERVKTPLRDGHLTKKCLSAENDPEKATRPTFIQRRKKRRIWECERAIRRFVEETPEAFFLVMTFSHWVTMESAKKRVRRFFDYRIGELVESYIRVMERHESGRPHANFIMRLAENVEESSIVSAIDRHGLGYGIGMFYFEPVESAIGISKYIVKELSKPHEGRAFSCSPDVKRFKYQPDREEWIRGMARFMEKNGCATTEEMTQKLGMLWPARYAVEIKILGKQRCEFASGN